MNAKQTALDAYLARTAAIHAKLERLQQLADDHFGHRCHHKRAWQLLEHKCQQGQIQAARPTWYRRNQCLGNESSR